MTEHVPSLLPSGKKWKLVWNDEFDGIELDRTKWDFRLHLLHTRYKPFTDEGAVLDGKGCLHLNLLKKDGQYCSPHLQTGYNFMDRPGKIFYEQFGEKNEQLTWPIAKLQKPKFMHKYGYYEIRCKLPKQEGWHCGFWLQSPIIGATLDPRECGVEVDIMENFTRNDMISHNNHWGGYADDHQHIGSGDIKLDPTPDGFHVFGLEWNEKEYVYYVDGKETWRVSEPVSQREQFIMVTTECMCYRSSDQPDEILKKAVLPDAFIVDYVRVFDEVKG